VDGKRLVHPDDGEGDGDEADRAAIAAALKGNEEAGLAGVAKEFADGGKPGTAVWLEIQPSAGSPMQVASLIHLLPNVVSLPLPSL